jgi:hypothetical protein
MRDGFRHHWASAWPVDPSGVLALMTLLPEDDTGSAIASPRWGDTAEVNASSTAHLPARRTRGGRTASAAMREEDHSLSRTPRALRVLHGDSTCARFLRLRG